MYVVAVASTSELPALPELSTLADCGLELLRVQERLVQSITAERHADLARLEAIAAELHAHESELASVRGQLAAAQAINRRWNESITLQLFQRVRGRVFAVLGGEATLAARGLRACVRLVGRVLLRSPEPPDADRSGAG